ncbi:MAG: dephospho-CoA kinase [Williamsia sp.]|nr:dephospho-CoA kinase [Williamsia sp.]
MLKIGLTGGIGSGKSLVAKLFEKLGVPVYYADLEAKRLMNGDQEIRQQITAVFGREAYVDNQLNRKYIASVVFDNKEKLARLNAIVHPATIRDSETWMQAQHTPYAIKEAALIFESHVDQYLDYVIGVSAPEGMRTRRIMARDLINEDAVESRMRNQLDETEKMRRCHFVLLNDESQLLMPQVLDLHKNLLQISAERKAVVE